MLNGKDKFSVWAHVFSKYYSNLKPKYLTVNSEQDKTKTKRVSNIQ